MLHSSTNLVNLIKELLMLLWTRIFHVRPYSIGETRFLFVKKSFFEKSESPLFYFYFKGKIKQEIKPLKK